MVEPNDRILASVVEICALLEGPLDRAASLLCRWHILLLNVVNLLNNRGCGKVYRSVGGCSEKIDPLTHVLGPRVYCLAGFFQTCLKQVSNLARITPKGPARRSRQARLIQPSSSRAQAMKFLHCV